MLKIFAKVCAEFHDKSGNVLYAIKPGDLLKPVIEAPESIQQDPLFDMLVNEKSLEVIGTKEELKRAENGLDPKAAEPGSGKAERNAPKGRSAVKSAELQNAAEPPAEPASAGCSAEAAPSGETAGKK